LSEIRGISGLYSRRIALATKHFWSTHRDKFQKIAKMVDGVTYSFPDELRNPFTNSGQDQGGRIYLRYPVLVRRDARKARIIARLRAGGVSATAMYGKTLPEIVNKVSDKSVVKNFPSAKAIAMQLLTLPIHNRIQDSDIQIIDSILRAEFGD